MRPGDVIWLLLVLLALLAARRFVDVVEVRGRSMAPTLLPGDRLLAVRLRRRPRRGEVVIAADPRDPGRELVKRVAWIGPTGVRLHGDNPAASTDARVFGAVPAAGIGWRIVLRCWPPGRIGPVPPDPRPAGHLEEGGEPACAVPEALIAGP